LSLTKKDSIQHFTLKDAIQLDSINHHHNIFVQNLPNIDSSVVALLDKPTVEENYEDLKLSNGKLIYTIKNGDNLGSIARHFGVTVKQLQKWNHLRSTRLHKGQTLAIYNKKYYQLGTVPETAQLREQPKENTTTPMVLASNKIEKKNKKNISANTQNNVSVHIIKNGDSLWKIAQKYHTTVEKIKTLNGLSSDKLSLGQQLKVK
jgi:membrane-bound lytic murein transglycosylase D